MTPPSPHSVLGLGPLVQVAYVTSDPVRSARAWIELFGAGPFFLFENIRFEGWTYHGQVTETPLDICAGQIGDLTVEFIRPRTNGPSVYRDVQPGGDGLHHFAVLSSDLNGAETLIGQGAAVTEAATPLGSRFRYYDLRPRLGAMLEVIEAGEDVRGLFALFADSARDWDGRTDPIRSMGL